MILKIMADRYGHEKAIQETREKWLEDLLLFIGIDIHLINQMDMPHFVEYLLHNKIELIEYLGINALQVKHNQEIIGEWAEPQLKLKQDKGGLYYEITIETWSIIEENIEI